MTAMLQSLKKDACLAVLTFILSFWSGLLIAAGPPPVPLMNYFLPDPPMDGSLATFSGKGCKEAEIETYMTHLGDEDFDLREEASRCLTYLLTDSDLYEKLLELQEETQDSEVLKRLTDILSYAGVVNTVSPAHPNVQEDTSFILDAGSAVFDIQQEYQSFHFKICAPYDETYSTANFYDFLPGYRQRLQEGYQALRNRSFVGLQVGNNVDIEGGNQFCNRAHRVDNGAVELNVQPQAANESCATVCPCTDSANPSGAFTVFRYPVVTERLKDITFWGSEDALGLTQFSRVCSKVCAQQRKVFNIPDFKQSKFSCSIDNNIPLGWGSSDWQKTRLKVYAPARVAKFAINLNAKTCVQKANGQCDPTRSDALGNFAIQYKSPGSGVYALGKVVAVSALPGAQGYRLILSQSDFPQGTQFKVQFTPGGNVTIKLDSSLPAASISPDGETWLLSLGASSATLNFSITKPFPPPQTVLVSK